jgi:hypothetical protein
VIADRFAAGENYLALRTIYGRYRHIDAQFDALLAIEGLVVDRTLGGRLLAEQHGLRQWRPFVWQASFVAKQRDRAVPAVFTQRMRGARAALPAADDHHRVG